MHPGSSDGGTEASPDPSEAASPGESLGPEAKDEPSDSPDPGADKPRRGTKGPRNRPKLDSVKEFGHLAGQIPDYVLAALAGVSTATVVKYRYLHDIPPWGGKPYSMADLPPPREPVSRVDLLRQKLDPYRDQIGKVPDQDIAERAGVSKIWVIDYRRLLDIPAFRPRKKAGSVTPKPQAPPPDDQDSRIERYAHLIGVLSDVLVAERAGVPPDAVRAWRLRRK